MACCAPDAGGAIAAVGATKGAVNLALTTPLCFMLTNCHDFSIGVPTVLFYHGKPPATTPPPQAAPS